MTAADTPDEKAGAASAKCARAWSDVLDQSRLDSLRTLVALHPANGNPHDTSRLAHLHLSRVLADMGDIDEAAITAVIAAATADSPGDEGACSLGSALDRTLRMRLNHRYILAILASAALRSHDTLRRMEKAGTGEGGYHVAQVDAQRHDSDMTLRAFKVWERLIQGAD